MIAAFFALAADQPPPFWPWIITAVAAVFAALAVSAISIVFHQLVTHGIGPIRFHPIRSVLVRIDLRRARRERQQATRRRELHAATAGRARPQ